MIEFLKGMERFSIHIFRREVQFLMDVQVFSISVLVIESYLPVVLLEEFIQDLPAFRVNCRLSSSLRLEIPYLRGWCSAMAFSAFFTDFFLMTACLSQLVCFSESVISMERQVVSGVCSWPRCWAGI